MQWTTLNIEMIEQVALLRFNRPDKANSLNQQTWHELRAALQWADSEPDVRVVVLAGEGRHFCSGIDLSMLMGIQAAISDECEARKREKLLHLIRDLQACVSALELCRKPVIAAIHGACLGGGLDIALAADFRFASADALFGVREVDLGLVADVGTLQRLPAIVGEGIAREMALTGRDVKADEALALRLVNRVLPDADTCLLEALACAHQIASKSPLAIRGTKEVMNYSRDHSVEDGLRYVSTWNSAMLMSEDLKKIAMGLMTQHTPRFRN